MVSIRNSKDFIIFSKTAESKTREPGLKNKYECIEIISQ